jgi:predicted lipoprotein with Yx(FWY)xxD motif
MLIIVSKEHLFWRKEKCVMEKRFSTKTRILLTIAICALVLAVIGADRVLRDEAAIKIKEKEGIGSYLVDSKGMTLYSFKNDSPSKSTCAGACVEKWPLFNADIFAVFEGINEKDIGTITRADGKKQTTYMGMPLYYFVGDKAPGDTHGQGVKDVWYVVVITP